MSSRFDCGSMNIYNSDFFLQKDKRTGKERVIITRDQKIAYVTFDDPYTVPNCISWFNGELTQLHFPFFHVFGIGKC